MDSRLPWNRRCNLFGRRAISASPGTSTALRVHQSEEAALSIGVFTGYTLSELVQGRWHWRNSDGGWTKGDARLFNQIRQFLDFAVCGRFRQAMACNNKPPCGSRNQEVVFFSDRYSEQDLQPQGYEVIISENGATAIITGFPPVELTARAHGIGRGRPSRCRRDWQNYASNLAKVWVK